MNRTILQVPMEKNLREQAEATAKFNGFSSLQEVVRVLLQKFARKELYIDVATQEERLSPKAERRYAKIVEDIKKGKNVTKTMSLNELFNTLNS